MTIYLSLAEQTWPILPQELASGASSSRWDLRVVVTRGRVVVRGGAACGFIQQVGSVGALFCGAGGVACTAGVGLGHLTTGLACVACCTLWRCRRPAAVGGFNDPGTLVVLYVGCAGCRVCAAAVVSHQGLRVSCIYYTWIKIYSRMTRGWKTCTSLLPYLGGGWRIH